MVNDKLELSSPKVRSPVLDGSHSGILLFRQHGARLSYDGLLIA